jgi:hypothetical protein
MTVPVGSLAEIATAVIALVAVGVAVWQRSEGRRLANQQYAREAWTGYLRLALAHPDLGSTEIALANSTHRSLAPLVQSGDQHGESYLWLLTILLDASESILEFLPDRAWRRAVISQVRYHVPTLELLWDDKQDPWRGYYSAALSAVVDEEIRAAAAKRSRLAAAR